MSFEFELKNEQQKLSRLEELSARLKEYLGRYETALADSADSVTIKTYVQSVKYVRGQMLMLSSERASEIFAELVSEFSHKDEVAKLLGIKLDNEENNNYQGVEAD